MNKERESVLCVRPRAAVSCPRRHVFVRRTWS